MEHVEEKIDLESDEEIPFSSSQSTSKAHAFDFEASHVGSHAKLCTSWVFKQMQIRPFGSIYIILIKAKINMLLPFGPLAILLHYLTGKHGWVFLFSLLGITPLAERLGYATEHKPNIYYALDGEEVDLVYCPYLSLP
ncbi:hypothetical protein Acr_23g0000250 [Actinidia rufa]|uniref:Uncharacterized protein n=1 Tax=Actinidia rufa TaxID=165716 RepID=A0A7J0GLH9_9ERIC|nr:hypothetical protein Acr_23g0000250 [Actinidia rufa]